MKKALIRYWKKFLLFWRELGNFFTNLMCPVMSFICAIAEILNLPQNTIKQLKNVEYWFWKISGTKDAIDHIVDQVDQKVDETAAKDDKIVQETPKELKK